MSDQPEDFSSSQISAARRRRRRYGFIPASKGDRALFLNQLAERLVANADFYLFSFLCGVVLAVAVLLDSPAIYVLAALLAPFMAPVVGLGFASVVGSLRFFVQSLGSLIIGALLVFGTGALGGWISRLFPDLQLSQAHFHVVFSVPDFILLTIGILLAIFITVKAPKSRSLVASVALAYEIYLPIGLAGFGLTSGFTGLFPQGLELAGIWLAWVIFAGTLFLAFFKVRPSTLFGYLLTAALLGTALYVLLSNSAFGAAIKHQLAATEGTPQVTQTNQMILASNSPELPTLTPTLTPQPAEVTTREGTATSTNTIAPTNTPTQTITPQATPMFAKVYSSTSTGVWLRPSPSFTDTGVLVSVGTLVEVLEASPTISENIQWVHVRVMDNGDNYLKEGWIAQSLLETATPSALW
jgi:uncharacterized membrane protein